MGFKLGANGIVTFKNSGLDDVFGQIDLKHVVIETDSPWLAPAPHRGKRNECAYIQLVAEKLAALHGTTVKEVATVTTRSHRRYFIFKFSYYWFFCTFEIVQKDYQITGNVTPDKPSILIIYTGGTIGMREDPETKTLAPMKFELLQEEIPELHKLDYHISSITFNPPIDSANMTPAIWGQIARTIKNNYSKYDCSRPFFTSAYL